jgi:hypothetical protein
MNQSRMPPTCPVSSILLRLLYAGVARRPRAGLRPGTRHDGEEQWSRAWVRHPYRFAQWVAPPYTGGRRRRRRGLGFFESYISDVINRDVRQLTEIQRTGDMRRLVNLIAASTSTLANPSNMANRLQV